MTNHQAQRIAGPVVAVLLAAGCGGPTDNASQPVGGDPYAGYSSAVYAQTSEWLCHPELSQTLNACMGDLRTIAVQADGSSMASDVPTEPDLSVDCFYVYPTTSTDPGVNSDRIADVQERQTTLLQTGRYRSVCRVFAPIYRQRSLPALAISGRTDAVYSDEQIAEANEVAYGDVLDAFKHYVANLSNGRGFLLLGHSQGARLLGRLVAEEIETNPVLRKRLISAHIPGTTLMVPDGADVGGSFVSTPACRHPQETQCIVAYVSYREGDPELADPRFGVTTQPGTEAVCVNPSSLSGGAAPLQARLPFVLPPVFQALVMPRGSGGPYANRAENLAAMAEGPFYAVPGQLSARCTRHPDSGAHYLEVRIDADPTDPRADDYPGEFFGGENWGLHLADLNLAQGDLVELARQQSMAYLSSVR